MPGQSVIRTAEEQGRNPYGTWDILHEARLRSTASRTNPQKERPVPNAPQNEPLHDTSTARDPEIRARCEMVHGLTYHQARGLGYIGTNGAPMKYSMKDLEHDMAKGYDKDEQMGPHMAELVAFVEMPVKHSKNSAQRIAAASHS